MPPERINTGSLPCCRRTNAFETRTEVARIVVGLYSERGREAGDGLLQSGTERLHRRLADGTHADLVGRPGNRLAGVLHRDRQTARLSRSITTLGHVVRHLHQQTAPA